MYLVYLIVSNKNISSDSVCGIGPADLYYVGMTNNFLNRWLQHNNIRSGGAKFTKKRRNWYPICIIDGFKTKREAMQCEWKFKTRKSKFARKFKGCIGRLQYLNHLLTQLRWTSKSPKIADQNLTVYLDDDYKHLINTVQTKELYWKY